MSKPPCSGPPRPWGTTAADGPFREKADRPADVKVPSKRAQGKRLGGGEADESVAEERGVSPKKLAPRSLMSVVGIDAEEERAAHGKA